MQGHRGRVSSRNPDKKTVILVTKATDATPTELPIVCLEASNLERMRRAGSIAENGDQRK
jgi:hypothetical protein